VYQLIPHQAILTSRSMPSKVACSLHQARQQATSLNRTNHVNPPPTPLLYPYHPQIPQLLDHPRKLSNPFLPIPPNLLHGPLPPSLPISIVHMIHPMSKLNLFRLFLFLLLSYLSISISFSLIKEGGMKSREMERMEPRAREDEEEGGDIPETASNTFNAI
jgi:hypothetical protein